MRTIPEVVEDIKGVLNIAARSEEFTGELLTEVDEFANEILVIDSVKYKREETKVGGKLWEVHYKQGDALSFRGILRTVDGFCYLETIHSEVQYIIPATSIHHIRLVEE